MFKKLKKHIENTNVKNLFRQVNRRNVCFIISTGRTGTNFMESFLSSASKDILCVHEPHPDLFGISIEKMRNKKNSDWIISKITEARVDLLNDFVNEGSEFYVESNPFATFLIPELRMVFPKAKFVFIYRDINTYLLSALNKSPQDDGVNNFYTDEDKRKRLTPQDLEDESFKENWASCSQAQRIAWYWKACNEYLLEFAKSNRDIVKEFKFEDLFPKDKNSRKVAISELFQFVGVVLNEVTIEKLLLESSIKRNETKDVYFNSLLELKKDEMKWIKSETEDVRKKLGYS